ncbi:hypothetical protein C2845_PM02G45090 [Panicum miliaceum]|uniref:DUF1618 domain-containing protein n=1 Tax=Panicum miliaceum TaxID=4540 RepID=A0A3L6SHA7_PANMI|nr:hypothetical protein C2845_PM02G45090 [Panicum miliaceum]
MVTFRRRNHAKRSYYFVYDAKDASLYMIPCIPHDLEARRAERGRLCVCTPATRENPAPDGTGGPWATKELRFPDLPQAFSADVMFSFGDKVFWADLSQAIAYTDLRDGSCSSVFIKCPRGYRIDFSALPTDAEIEPPNMSRTMGCVEGSIKFVCISRGVTRRPGNEIVEEWKEEKGFPCLWKDLWKQTFDMDANLKYMLPLEPQYPILTPDGALSLLLPNRLLRRKRAKEADYICSFDMVSESCLCLGHVDNYHSIGPVILPYNFFSNCCTAPLERNLPAPKRKLPSIVQAPMRRPAFVQVVPMLHLLI